MAETFGDVKSFSKQLSQREIDEGRVYIKESYATTLFGYPSNARGDAKVDLVLFDAHSKSKKICLCKDGDKYYFNQGWSQFAGVKNLSAGDTITLTKMKHRSTKTKDFMFGVTKN
ncbi:hypothetical protein FH972_018812 [Carpinus fangiana]|uniref:TF-B3 domain-containing protein n=1 Tax=Carpinus fangiana TaxID=176857 RepID=A0A5N6RRQ8_9ROSI|nr:hypothetical protein FH972_018812 [Carpinus fangiana]